MCEKKNKLEVRGLCKSFASSKILQDINFDVKDGEFLSILGPSGCGKTTILRILIGLETLDNGSIYKNGEEISNYSPSERGMGIVFQNYALFENMTVLENVKYALKHKAEYKKNADEIAERMLGIVGLLEHMDKKPHKLSGGQQQRVAIARTLALNPDIILFDEPMSALDVDTRLALRVQLKELQAEIGTTMIYVTHDQEEAFAMSDRIMVMDRGFIHQLDTPKNIIENPANEYVQNFVIKNIQMKINSLIQFLN